MKKYFSKFLRRLAMEKQLEFRNYCGECGCHCECDGKCEGDYEKCTSEIALKKKCTHHCLCYARHIDFSKFEKTIKTGKR